MKTNKLKFDIHQAVTDKIVKEIETNQVLPWVKSWNNTTTFPRPHNAVSKRPYSGVNILLLWIASQHGGYSSNGWLTFKQAQALGGSVKKGEKGTHITFVKTLEYTKDKAGNDLDKPNKVFLMQGYTVFNVEQCEGLPEKYTTQKIGHVDDFDAFVAKTGIQVRHGTNQPLYSPAFDRVEMPTRDSFKSADSYKSTMLHELTHATGHKSRLDRDLAHRFGTEQYAGEELIAELGSAFMCADMGITPECRHVDYIASWLKLLKNDSKAIFTAASAASKACEWLSKHGAAEDEDAADMSEAA